MGSGSVKVGDIVQRRRHGGSLQHPRTGDRKQEIGLVIEILAEEGSIPQLRVQVPSAPEKPLWFFSHEVRKVTAVDNVSER